MPKSAYRLALMLLKHGMKYNSMMYRYKSWTFCGWNMTASKQYVRITKSNEYNGEFVQFDINPQSQFGLAIRQA